MQSTVSVYMMLSLQAHFFPNTYSLHENQVLYQFSIILPGFVRLKEQMHKKSSHHSMDMTEMTCGLYNDSQ